MKRLLPLFAVLLIALQGCATVQPQVGPDPTIDYAYETAPTLDNAVKVGVSMKQRYAAKVEGGIALERGTGLGLIGVAAIAADLAIRSVGPNAILGLGVGGGAAYTGSNWLTGKPQQLIYAAGANAVQCALDAMQPLRVADVPSGTLSGLIARIDEGQMRLSARLAVEGTVPDLEVLQARAAVERARAFLPAARDAQSLLNAAGGTLRSSLSAIQFEVTNAVVTNAPSLQSLVESLGKSLPSLGSSIVGVSLPVVPKVAQVNSAADRRQMAAETRSLEADIARAAAIVAQIGTKPSAEQSKLCHLDLRQAGLTMQVSPATEIAVDPGGSAVGLAVSGGVLPYRQTWIGKRPAADQLDVTIETGRGEILVAAKKNASPGRYQMLILDAASGRVPVTIEVTDKQAQASLAPVRSPSEAKAACAFDARLKAVQEALLKKSTAPVKVDGKDAKLVADGCPGPITTAAMVQFYKSQQGIAVTDDQVPKGKTLLDSVAGLLGV